MYLWTVSAIGDVNLDPWFPGLRLLFPDPTPIYCNFPLDTHLKLRSNPSPMETLNLSESTPRGDGRLKSLFWPTIHSATDVDSLGTQGYWVCTLVAVISTALLLAISQPIAAVATFLMYYAGGVGVRERSPYAAAAVLLMSLAEIVASGPSIPRIIFAALFLSNLRGTWIAAGWKSDSEEADLPPRLNETLGDKLADQFPKWLWPKLRILYYIFSFGMLALVVAGLIIESRAVQK